MKADVCEILAHETCSESTKDKRGERVCVLVGQSGEQGVFALHLFYSHHFYAHPLLP